MVEDSIYYFTCILGFLQSNIYTLLNCRLSVHMLACARERRARSLSANWPLCIKAYARLPWDFRRHCFETQLSWAMWNHLALPPLFLYGQGFTCRSPISVVKIIFFFYKKLILILKMSSLSACARERRSRSLSANSVHVPGRDVRAHSVLTCPCALRHMLGCLGILGGTVLKHNFREIIWCYCPFSYMDGASHADLLFLL